MNYTSFKDSKDNHIHFNKTRIVGYLDKDKTAFVGRLLEEPDMTFDIYLITLNGIVSAANPKIVYENYDFVVDRFIDVEIMEML